MVGQLPMLSPAPLFDLDGFTRDFQREAEAQGFVAEMLGEALAFWRRPGASGPMVFISAGIHGDEPAGPRAFLRTLAGTSFPKDIDWILAPVLNPTGLIQGSRENADGIDLNRDFLRQRAWGTRAMVQWWERQPGGCAIHLSLHEDWEAEGFYLYEINTGGRESFAACILGSLARSVPLQCTGPVDDHLLNAPGLIVHPPIPDDPEGWPEAIWLVKRYPALSYTFEAPGQAPRECREQGLAIALQAAIECSHRNLV